MAEFPQPKFEIGQRVFTVEGRTGLVAEVFFASAVNSYRYIVDGIGGLLEEVDLQDIPFAISGPLTFREQLEVDLLLRLQGLPGTDVRWWVGTQLDVGEDALEDLEGQLPGGTIEAALVFWAGLGFFPPGEEPPPPPPADVPIVPIPVPGEVPAGQVALLDEVDLRIALAIGPVVQNSIDARQQLEASLTVQIELLRAETEGRFALRESVVTDALNTLENSLLALEQSAQDSSGLDLTGLLGSLGLFTRDPLGWFLDTAEDAITGEILDGLTR